jgi:hypothetical protein
MYFIREKKEKKEKKEKRKKEKLKIDFKRNKYNNHTIYIHTL